MKLPNQLKIPQISEQVNALEIIKLIKESLTNATKVVGWYGEYEEIRGPFCRWLVATDVQPEYKKHVGSKHDDAKYGAICMSFAPKLALEYEKLLDANKELKEENKQLKELVQELRNTIFENACL